MERFAAESLKAERDASIKAALKANVPWTEVAETFGLSHTEIEQMVLDSVPGAKRKGSALVVVPGNDKGKEAVDDGW